MLTVLDKVSYSPLFTLDQEVAEPSKPLHSNSQAVVLDTSFDDPRLSPDTTDQTRLDRDGDVIKGEAGKHTLSASPLREALLCPTSDRTLHRDASPQVSYSIDGGPIDPRQHPVRKPPLAGQRGPSSVLRQAPAVLVAANNSPLPPDQRRSPTASVASIEHDRRLHEALSVSPMGDRSLSRLPPLVDIHLSDNPIIVIGEGQRSRLSQSTKSK